MIRLIAIWLCITTTSIAANPATRPTDIPTEMRAADATFQALLGQVLSLQLAGERSVSELLAMVPDAECQLRRMVFEKHQRSALRRRVDGTVEMDALLPTSMATQIIQEVAARFLPGVDLSLLAVQMPSQPSLIATVCLPGDTKATTALPGWRHYSMRQIELTRSAAAVDLRHRLLMRLTYWRVSANQTLGQLWTSRPDFRQAVVKQIEILPTGEPIFEPAGLCRLPTEFHRSEIISVLVQAAEKCEPLIEADLSQAIDPDYQNPLVLDGLAVAPPVEPTMAESVDSIRMHLPQWIDRFLTARQTSPPRSETADQKARRKQALIAARIEAKRKLWVQIEQLTLPAGGTIGELLTDSPGAVQAFAAIEAAIIPTATPKFDEAGNASVSLGVKLQIVWEIIRELPIQADE